ncbi:hypothetical protein JCM8208_004387 [Rhodotorula glutinis]
MSSTHALEQPRPFDRLPTELLVKMLLHLPPPIILFTDGDSPPHIQNTLFAVSLVSRRFNASSRNLLWRGCIIHAWSTPANLLQAIALLAEWPAIARLGPELHLRDVGGRPLRDWAVVLPDIGRAVASASQGRSLKLVDLSTFHNLRHLSLHRCRIELSPTMVFPHLNSLRLFYVEVAGAPPGAVN